MAMTVDDALAETSVIIPVKNDLKLIHCLASIDEDVEVVLALNAATDEVRRIAKEYPGRSVVTEIDEANIGAAYNAGVRVAGGRFLLFMDSDCVFRPGTIRAMASEVVHHPVVKGRCVFTAGTGRLSDIIRRDREFHTSDFVNAYSPPLIYDVGVVPAIGGYHYDDLIHSRQDREFDFRLQLAGIPVHLRADAEIYHAAQTGAADLRSGLKYGMGEAIGRELGLFVTPSIRWEVADFFRSVAGSYRTKGPGPAAYRFAWLLVFYYGFLKHTLRDPYGVRPRYPAGARRARSRTGLSVHRTQLDDAYRTALRASHARQGRLVPPPD